TEIYTFPYTTLFRSARLGMADVDQSEIRGEPDVAQHAERGGDWLHRRIELAQLLRLGHEVILPASVAGHDVAGPQRSIARLLDTAHRAADHRLADLHRRRVGLGVFHAAAHVRIDREIERSHESFARARRQDGGFHQAKIRFFRKPGGPRSQNNLAIPLPCYRHVRS